MANHEQRGVLLWEHRDALSDSDYWRAVADAWQDSDRQPLAASHWRELWTAKRPERDCAMTDAERLELAALPERVTVYRGVGTWNCVSGIAWSLERPVAESFARRGGGIGVLITGKVRRGRILALYQARREAEVVVPPRYVYARSWEPLPAIPVDNPLTAKAS